jgi:hypothetical protein
MDIDPIESANSAAEETDSKAAHDARLAANARLSTLVAITVALLATFLGVCKVKDDNIVQEMQQAQADKIDNWNFYQARNIREDVAKAAIKELQLAELGASPAADARYQEAIKQYEATVKDQETKKESVRATAEQDQKTYDALNYRDDQFDLSDALIALAISLLAMTALTHKPWLYGLSLIPTFLGVLMGLAGLLGWHLHSDLLAKLLS